MLFVMNVYQMIEEYNKVIDELEDFAMTTTNDCCVHDCSNVRKESYNYYKRRPPLMNDALSNDSNVYMVYDVKDNMYHLYTISKYNRQVYIIPYYILILNFYVV